MRKVSKKHFKKLDVTTAINIVTHSIDSTQIMSLAFVGTFAQYNLS